ncbi:MAG: prepilin-type N-terminal cleavage/methylation domain-containing protein [Opitutales bacterium]
MAQTDSIAIRRVPGNRTSGKQGFTLLEILLALFLGSMILVSVSTFLFSMGELWGRGGDERLFERHVNGVTRFLQNNLTTTFHSQADGGDNGSQAPATIASPPSQRDIGDGYISFELLESPGFFSWPDDRPLPFVVCYLELAPGEGLSVLWHSRLEIDFEDQMPRKTLLSPFAREWTFEYYDVESETWTERNDFERDDQQDYLLPDRVRIRFAWKTFEKERVVTLPLQRETGAISWSIR